MEAFLHGLLGLRVNIVIFDNLIYKITKFQKLVILLGCILAIRLFKDLCFHFSVKPSMRIEDSFFTVN